jgi:hypothetical protein
MKELKETILSVLVFLSGIYAVYVSFIAITKWADL